MSESEVGQNTNDTPVDSDPSRESEIPTIDISSSDSRKRAMTSKVWNDFKKIKKDDGTEFAQCIHCEGLFKHVSRNGTSGLSQHLKRCPKLKNVDIRQQMISIKENRGVVSFGNFSFDQEVCREKLANFIIMHDQPLSIVDYVGFKDFINNLQPMFMMVSRNTIKSDILRSYASTKKQVCKIIEKVNGRVSITTDMWSSCQKKGYMAVTCHFIDDSWVLQKRIIRFAYVPAPHTKDVLCEVLMETLLDWNIDRKLSTITVDNCSTNDAMVSLLKDQLVGSLLLDGKILHMRCCAHILHLIVQDGLDVIRNAPDKVRNCVCYWSATPSRIENFEEAAKQLRVSTNRRLSLDCKTRWNSTFLMLQCALKYKDVFTRLKQRGGWNTSLPSEEDWKTSEEVCEKLEMFYNASQLFSGTKYPTSNLFFTTFCEMKIELMQWLESDSMVIREMATYMVAKFEKYWSVCSLVMAMAIVLDHRYKMKAVEFYYCHVFGATQSLEEAQKVQNGIYSLVNEYQSRNKAKKSFIASSSSLSQGPICKSTKNLHAAFDNFIHDSMTDLFVKSELDHYLEEVVLPRIPEFDILTWWKTNGVKYPNLMAIARDILAIPISTVSSESAFSTGGRIVDSHRSKLHPETIEALMCTRDWLWADRQVGCATPMSLSSVETDSD